MRELLDPSLAFLRALGKGYCESLLYIHSYFITQMNYICMLIASSRKVVNSWYSFPVQRLLRVLSIKSLFSPCVYLSYALKKKFLLVCPVWLSALLVGQLPVCPVLTSWSPMPTGDVQPAGRDACKAEHFWNVQGMQRLLHRHFQASFLELPSASRYVSISCYGSTQNTLSKPWKHRV